ncbi:MULTISPECIES: hypothetical protein [Legionella]|uniref:Uncharacterized protein n=2 Tax=Legionella TaxID=445 RepID=A0A0W0S9U3_9GAMM|nr:MULTISPECIES: hypothetical protein [Legionella]KTC80138.1 hypothetical protein Lche_2158 [Legionella cherrii]MCL9682845.1 hypothetical protein [Legionella maioricensis]MCL9686527.1 hypothetical protein [Legionella maioricensis]
MRILGTFKVIIALVTLVSSMLLFSSCASSTAAGSSQNTSQTDKSGYGWPMLEGMADTVVGID